MTEALVRREFALKVVRRLRQAGYQSLWAGGCVRDLILGEVPADYDVATDATPEQVLEVLPYRAISVGVSFGVLRVRDPRHVGVEVEVSTFRSDGAYVDGRRPESVVFSSPAVDAARRDFTINGMFLDPLTDQVIDYIGGREDLERRVLRAIGDATARFREDKLRLLRGIRLAARFELEIEPATLAAIRAMAAEVVLVSAERIAQELRRMLVHSSRARAMELALETGLLAAILLPVVEMKGLFQGKPMQPEGDLWAHAMLVLALLPPDPSFALAFAALLHDVGKPATRVFQHGHYRFHNHELRGAEIADGLCRELKLSNHERERITWLVANHQYLGEAMKLRESKLKRILAEPGIEELLPLHRADALASTGDTQHVDYCQYYLRNQPDGPINPPPLVTGHDLVRHGLKPGPRFAELLERIRELQLDRQLQSKREALDWLDRQSSSRTFTETAAVLTSGGLDSAILCVDLLRLYARVVPIYIRSGLRWESAELASLYRFLAAVKTDALGDLVVVDEPVADVYGAHWSITGAAVPDESTRDEAVYLPGRNLLLTVKAAVWCQIHGIGALALGSLGSNPFPDSTAAFFRKLEGVLNEAMAGQLRLIRPFDRLAKADVLGRARHLPLELTFSCINPADGRHCGVCNKCAERKKGFREAGLPDRTEYFNEPASQDAVRKGAG
jgi:poly(A) polymerase